LAEVLQVPQLQVVAREVEEGVEEHGSVAQGQNEPVPVRPGGIGGIVSEVPGPDLVAGGGQPHGRSGMSGVGPLNGVHGKDADGVDEVRIVGVFLGDWHRARLRLVGIPGRQGIRMKKKGG
jgi:hypothetical protein